MRGVHWVAAMGLALGTIAAARPCPAQHWAESMFASREHDFGAIARGSKAEHEFVFTNRFIEDVRVASVRTSCGCTSVSIKQPLLKTYETSAIVARINSDTFLGRQGATITVTFDQPMFAQVQLHVKVFVRSDVVFEPGAVIFGGVDAGAAAQRAIRVTRYGRGPWNISKILSPHESLRAEVVDTLAAADRTIVNLRVTLAETAPPGPIGGQLILVTNDPQSPQIPLAVEGHVLAAVTASPAVLFLGTVAPGGYVARQVVLRGKKPFRIVGVESDSEALEATIAADSPPKTLHLLPVRFTAPPEPGKARHTLRIRTDLDGAEAVVEVHAAVVAPEQP